MFMVLLSWLCIKVIVRVHLVHAMNAEQRRPFTLFVVGRFGEDSRRSSVTDVNDWQDNVYGAVIMTI